MDNCFIVLISAIKIALKLPKFTSLTAPLPVKFRSNKYNLVPLLAKFSTLAAISQTLPA